MYKDRTTKIRKFLRAFYYIFEQESPPILTNFERGSKGIHKRSWFSKKHP